MAKATWNGAVLAESETFAEVEGNIYFPPKSVNREYFRPSDKTTLCPWKGTARYYDVVVDGKVNENAAWTYPDPSEKAMPIKGHLAFWNGVQVAE